MFPVNALPNLLDTEAEILVRALSAEALGRTASDEIQTSCNVNKLLDLAGRSGLMPLLINRWSNVAKPSSLIEKVLFVASIATDENRKRNTALLSLAMRSARCLSEVGVESLMLKGAAFLAEEGDGSIRALTDVDILVAPDNIERAAGVLLAAGFELAMSAKRYRAEDQHHYPPLTDKTSGYSVELHSRINWDVRRNPITTNLIFEKAMHAKHATQLLVPDPTHRMIHLITHAQLTDRNYLASQMSLKDVADFSRMARAYEIDWVEVERCFSSVGARRELMGFLHAAVTLLEDAAPSIPLDVASGGNWSRRAIRSIAFREQGRARLIFGILGDYASQIMRNPSKIALVVSTLVNAERRGTFFGTHWKRLKR